MNSPILEFGRYRGQSINQIPGDYIRWLADPARDTDPKYRDRKLPENIVAAARERLVALDDTKAREEFAARCMGGHPTGFDTPIYIIECHGDCHSKSGSYAIDNQWFPSLELSLAYLASEYPAEGDAGDDDADDYQQTPDPEDDKILIWEVLPEGHRKIVWGFFGWHHSADDHECGQGSLPGHCESLYAIAVRDC